MVSEARNEWRVSGGISGSAETVLWKFNGSGKQRKEIFVCKSMIFHFHLQKLDLGKFFHRFVEHLSQT